MAEQSLVALRRRHLTSKLTNSLCDAVGGGEDVDVVDERAAAELPVAVEDGRHEGELVVPRHPPVHDVRRGRRRQPGESVQQSHFGSRFTLGHFNLQIEMQIGAQMRRTGISI